MGINEGIRDSVADVYVQAGDIRTGVITFDKLASNTILPEQLDKSIGHVYTDEVVALTAAATAVWSFTASADCVVMDAQYIITAVGTTGDLTLETTAAVTMIANFVTTGTATQFKSTAMCVLTAGASLELACTGSTTNTQAGRIILTYFYT